MPTADELYDEADKLKDAGKLDEAVAKYNEILAAEPNHVITHAALAVAYIKLKQPNEAIQHAQKVCELEPNDAFSYTALSVTFQRAFTITNNPQLIHLAEDAMALCECCKAGTIKRGTGILPVNFPHGQDARATVIDERQSGRMPPVPC